MTERTRRPVRSPSRSGARGGHGPAAPLRGEVDRGRAEGHAEMLANRVVKAHRKLAPRFARENVGAFRLYDRDIPEIRAVVDWYEGHLVVAEYERRQTEAAGDWLGIVARAAAEALGVPEDRLHLKQRRTRPKDGEAARYRRLSQRHRRLQVREGDMRFLVNLDDYVDTGLFLDHRITRRIVAREAGGRRVLNLFAYTGGFTVAAALGGAAETTSVDQSGTYLDWLRDNLDANGAAGARHRTVRADVVAFLRDALRDGMTWDLVVLDPPSFSTLGGSSGLDVQRDHRKLVIACLAALAPKGVLWFSTNHQRFEPDLGGLPAASVEDVTERTIPEDFRNRTVHRCWRLVAAD